MTTLPQQPVAPAFVAHPPGYRGPGLSITISPISYIVNQNLRVDFPLAGWGGSPWTVFSRYNPCEASPGVEGDAVSAIDAPTRAVVLRPSRSIIHELFRRGSPGPRTLLVVF